MLAVNFKPVYFLSNEYVVRKGDMGQEVKDTLYLILYLAYKLNLLAFLLRERCR